MINPRITYIIFCVFFSIFVLRPRITNTTHRSQLITLKFERTWLGDYMLIGEQCAICPAIGGKDVTRTTARK